MAVIYKCDLCGSEMDKPWDMQRSIENGIKSLVQDICFDAQIPNISLILDTDRHLCENCDHRVRVTIVNLQKDQKSQ